MQKISSGLNPGIQKHGRSDSSIQPAHQACFENVGGKRERTQNSEIYYSRIKILGNCLFLQSVPANLQAYRLHIKQ